jgi:hypothetical protein
MLSIHLDTIASGFTFAGGVVLAIDALCVRRRIKQRRGTETLVEAIKKFGDNDLVYDPNNTPLNTRGAIEDWFAERTLRFAWIGFILLSVGFGLDLFCKLQSH